MTRTLRRGADRRRIPRRNDDVWATFDPEDRRDALADGFGNLELFNESRLGPGANVQRYAHDDAEIVTYVREGRLRYEDGAGRPGYCDAGEFRRMTAGSGFRHQEKNASRTASAHVFHMVLRAAESGIDPSHEQQRFSAAERRGRLCVIASPDARQGSLRMHQDTFVFSALLGVGRHVVHLLSPGRCAWLHVVTGDITVLDLVMSGGDGLSFVDEPSISVTAAEEAEILLVEMADQRPKART